MSHMRLMASKPTLLNVSAVFEAGLNIYRRKCKSRELTIEQQIETNLTSTALDGEVKQIFSSLLPNGIDTSTEGSKIPIRARIVRSLRSDSRAALITFAEGGIGISDEQR